MHGSRPKYVVIDYTDLRPGDKAPEPVELDDLPQPPSPQEPLTEAGPSRASPAASSPAARTATPAPTAPASRAPEPKTPIWQRAMRSVQQLLKPREATGRGAPKAAEPTGSPTPSAVEAAPAVAPAQQAAHPAPVKPVRKAAAAEKVSKAAESPPPVRTPQPAAQAPAPEPATKAAPVVDKAPPEVAKPLPVLLPLSAVAAHRPEPSTAVPKLELKAAPVAETAAPQPKPEPKSAPVVERAAPEPEPKPEKKAVPVAGKAIPEPAKPSPAAIEAPLAGEGVVPPPAPPVPAALPPPAGSIAAQAGKPRPSSTPQPPAQAQARPSKRTRGKKVLPPRSRPQKPAQVSSSPPAAQAPPAPPTAPAPAFPRSGSANVIALSDNRTLIDVLRDSLAGSHRVWRADDVAHAGELIVSAGNAVFLVDASLPGLDTREFVGSLHGQFPELAIIVVVNRDNEAPLAPLVASGAIYRCIDAAATAESIRHLIDATQRGPWSSVDRRGGTPRKSVAAFIGRARRWTKDARTKLPKIRISMSWVRRWTGRCLKLGAALAAGWVLWQWKPWIWVGDLLPEPDPAPAAVAEAEQPAARLKKLLADAEVALSRNRLVEPPGRNALELYRAALALDPANEMARWGVDSVADRLLDEADEALRARDLPRLASAIDAARSARPDHPRLAEYSASLRREQERVFGPGISAR